MAVLGTTVPTLADIAAAAGPDGTFDSDRVNLLAQTNEMLDDMVWKEGNLPTGHQTTLITGLPTVGFRRFNEGVALSKSTGAKLEEGSAMLEGFFQVDRALAIMSGTVNQYRLEESGLFMEAMNQTLQTYVLYGNSSTMPESFTGVAARYNTLSGPIGQQIVNAGKAQSAGQLFELEAGLAHALQLAIDDGPPVGHRLFERHAGKPLTHLGARTVGKQITERGIEPVA